MGVYARTWFTPKQGGGALGVLEEWSMCCGYRASARDEEQERRLSAAPQDFDDASLGPWSGGELKLVNRRHLAGDYAQAQAWSQREPYYRHLMYDYCDYRNCTLQFKDRSWARVCYGPPS